MRVPDITIAKDMLEEAAELNPGPWLAHSRSVAEAAQRISASLSGLDPNAAYVLGLLHDIGRREGVTGMRHVVDGYSYLAAQGFDDAARISITHSFAVRDVRAIFGEWDCTADELSFLTGYLDRIEYDDYDRLVQLCDSLAMAEGFVLMEKRMLDVAMRYGGLSVFTLAKYRATFAIKRDFEQRMGHSIYDLLPGVVENTFR